MTYSRPWMLGGLTLMAVGVFWLWQQGRQPTAQAEPPETVERPRDKPADNASPGAPSLQKTSTADPYQWRNLFDGKTLGDWNVPDSYGKENVSIKDGAIVMEVGDSMTGVSWTGKVPRTNYELELEGMRLEGSDFFCTTTFPVGKDHCSLVVGGWGGQLVGLSNVDHEDASENRTKRRVEFEDNRWYPVRIRVSEAAIEVSIDGKQLIFQPRKDHRFGIRIEVVECRPLGICTWYTKGAVRNIRLRELKPEEIREAAAKARAAEEKEP